MVTLFVDLQIHQYLMWLNISFQSPPHTRRRLRLGGLFARQLLLLDPVAGAARGGPDRGLHLLLHGGVSPPGGLKRKLGALRRKRYFAYGLT